jgi:hypothetical protein
METEDKIARGKPKCWRQDIKMDIASLGHYGVDSIHASHNKARRRNFVKRSSYCLENWHTVDRGGKRHELWLYTTQRECMTSKYLKLYIN